MIWQKFGKYFAPPHSADLGQYWMFAPSIDWRKAASCSLEGLRVKADLVDMCPPRPARTRTTMSAVAARGTVEMLNAPEWAKVSTDVLPEP